MSYFPLIFGLIQIGLGLVIWKLPHIVFTPGLMSPKEKEKIDIQGAGRLYGRGLVATGAVTIIGYYFLLLIGWKLPLEFVLLFPLVIMLLFLIPQTRKYDRRLSPILWWLTTIVAIAAFAVIVGVFFWPARIAFEHESIRITGLNGTEITGRSLAGAELNDTIPPITGNSGGLRFFETKKGAFLIKGFGKCMLYTHPCENGPYLIMTDTAGSKTIFRTRDKAAGIADLEEIRQMMNRGME